MLGAQTLITPTSFQDDTDLSGSASRVALPAACDAYVRTLERFARCSQLTPQTARSLYQQIAQLRAMYTQYATTAPESMLQSCVMANEATTTAMIQLGC